MANSKPADLLTQTDLANLAYKEPWLAICWSKTKISASSWACLHVLDCSFTGGLSELNLSLLERGSGFLTATTSSHMVLLPPHHEHFSAFVLDYLKTNLRGFLCCFSVGLTDVTLQRHIITIANAKNHQQQKDSSLIFLKKPYTVIGLS